MTSSALSWVKWSVGIIVCAWLGQYLLAMAVPNIVMETLYRVGSNQNGVNTLVFRSVPDETSRDVVRPSPDLLYAMCIYNLENGPVVIEAPTPERYWSMQFYQMNTDNYAGITNQRDERNRIGMVSMVTLIGPDQDVEGHDGEVIQSPTQRGVMLLRASAIGDLTKTRKALQNSSCKSIGRGV